MTKFTDKTDVSNAISLYEQGCIRDPKTHKTIMTYYNIFKERNVAISTYISEQDVIDALEEMNELHPNFFEYISETYEDVIDNLDKDHLCYYIEALNDYNGWFNGE